MLFNIECGMEDNNFNMILFLNTSSIIEHEAVLGNHNHLSVNAILCGRVKVGDNCMIGAGAVIRDKVSICDNVTIGAGSVVTKSIFERGTYIGVPARKVT